MAEYVLSDDDSKEEIAKMLLEHAGDRSGEIEWRPRPDRPQGGVFHVPDDLADGLTSDRLSRLDSTPANDPGNVDTGTTENEGGGSTRASRAAARRAAKAAEASKE